MSHYDLNITFFSLNILFLSEVALMATDLCMSCVL